MKYLSDYTEAPMTAVFEMYGCFFAFSDKQFDERAKPLVDYVQLSSGLICPRYHAGAVVKALMKVLAEAIKQDIKENGIHPIVCRELNNQEAYYTGSIESTVDALADYGISAKIIRSIYNDTKN